MKPIESVLNEETGAKEYPAEKIYGQFHMPAPERIDNAKPRKRIEPRVMKVKKSPVEERVEALEVWVKAMEARADRFEALVAKLVDEKKTKKKPGVKK